MSYSCLVGSGRVVPKFHYCDPTRPDQTCLRPDKKSVHVEIEPTRSATQKKPEKSATRPDFVGDPGRSPGSPTKSGRVAVVGSSLKSTRTLNRLH